MIWIAIVERLPLLANSDVDAVTVRLALPASTPSIASNDTPLSDRLDGSARSIIRAELE